jgi:hypothetical protein
MGSLDQFIDDRFLHGRAQCSREESKAALELKPAGLTAAIKRLLKKRRLEIPRHGVWPSNANAPLNCI